MARPAKYPEQFRRDAVELVESSGRSIAEVARSLSINEGTLWNWLIRAEGSGDLRNVCYEATGPNIMLIGPPGVGKTILARRSRTRQPICGGLVNEYRHAA